MKIKNVEMYQAKNGSIQLLLDRCNNFALSIEQITLLGDGLLVDIEDFNIDDYINFYQLTK